MRLPDALLQEAFELARLQEISLGDFSIRAISERIELLRKVESKDLILKNQETINFEALTRQEYAWPDP